MSHFSLVTFRICPLVFSSLNILCLGMVFFEFIQLGIYWDLGVCKCMSINKFGKFLIVWSLCVQILFSASFSLLSVWDSSLVCIRIFFYIVSDLWSSVCFPSDDFSFQFVILDHSYYPVFKLSWLFYHLYTVVIPTQWKFLISEIFFPFPKFPFGSFQSFQFVCWDVLFSCTLWTFPLYII